MKTTILIGILTMYSQTEHMGQPLYCDRGHGLTYNLDAEPWVALPVIDFQSGRARCGDLIHIVIGSHTIDARALDAGPLDRYHIADHPRLAIIADIPEHLWPVSGISHPGTLINLSALARYRFRNQIPQSLHYRSYTR